MDELNRTSSRQIALDQLHAKIDACRICEKIGNFRLGKVTGIRRGNAVARVVAVGVGPGSQAAASKLAFAGGSFTRLHKWFEEAGFIGSQEQLRERLYLTSLIKCMPAPDNALARAAYYQNCRSFLFGQLELIKPMMVLLLGVETCSAILGRQMAAKECAGNDMSTEQINKTQLFKVASVEAKWFLLPHPSGLSRTMNDPKIHKQVIEALRTIIRDGAIRSEAAK